MKSQVSTAEEIPLTEIEASKYVRGTRTEQIIRIPGRYFDPANQAYTAVLSIIPAVGDLQANIAQAPSGVHDIDLRTAILLPLVVQLISSYCFPIIFG